MENKDIQDKTKEKYKSINSNNKFKELKSDFFLEILLILLFLKGNH